MHVMLQRKKTFMSCPAIERRLRRNHRAGHLPEKQTDDDGFQIVSCSRRHPQTPHRATSVQIETKTFEFNVSRDFIGCSLHLKCRHNLSRSIFVPLNGLSWLTRVSGEALGNQEISHPKWRNTLTKSSFTTNILAKARGSFFRIAEFLSDGRYASICIPEGHQRLAGLSSTSTSTDFVSTMKSHSRSASNLSLTIIGPETPTFLEIHRPFLIQLQPQPIQCFHHLSGAKNRNHGPIKVKRWSSFPKM